jgi:hypothetical protein
MRCREVSAEALSSADETAKPVPEAVLTLSASLSSGGNTTIRSNPYKHADQVTHLNCDHRRGRDQRGGDGALLMHDLNRAGNDYGQKSCWDENANSKAESEHGADEKKEDECHFSAPKIFLPFCLI